jgi:hypothetical protein
MRWLGHINMHGWKRDAYKILVGKPEGKIYSEAPGVDGRIILK